MHLNIGTTLESLMTLHLRTMCVHGLGMVGHTINERIHLEEDSVFTNFEMHQT